MTFIFKYRPLGMVKKNFYIQTFILFTRLDMLRANDIVPLARYPEPLEPQDTPPTSKMPSGKARGEYVQVKKEVESRSKNYDEDSLNMREKALLVCFRFHVENYR